MSSIFNYSHCTVLWLLMVYCGVLHCRNINDGKLNKECTLLENSLYIYTDINENEIFLPHTVDDGSNVTVKCKYPSIYEYYDVIGENETLICNNGNFPDVSIYCQDSSDQTETANPCEQFVLRNGQVSHNALGEYYVICDIGYTINLPTGTADRPCECTEGELRCFGRIKPVCKADTCKIPFGTDRRLSIYQLPNRVYRSEGEVVEHDSYVFFNCSNVEEQKYEPANRRFQCKFGRWKESERNPNWNFGNNGQFPECREAICDPLCENGGVCYRDGQCRCQHMTAGKRCGTLLCDVRCTKNGGECIRPGVCGNCPVFRSGENCEKAIRCDKIKNLYGGDVIYFAGREVGTEVFYNCEDGYTEHPEDLEMSICTWTGKEAVWLPDPPTCLETANIEIPTNGDTDTDAVIVEHGHSYNIFCNQGYEFYRGGFLDVDTFTITNHNGTLKPKVPSCKPARCDPGILNETIVSFRNGTKITDLVPSNTPVQYSCIPGYRFRNKNLGERVNRKCDHGEFVRLPRCIPKPCTIGKLKMNSFSNLEYYPDSYSFLFPGFDVIHGAMITVSCRTYQDYELFVQSTQTYIPEFMSVCDYGTFDMKDEEFPICLEKRCHFEMSPEYCFWKNDTTRDNCSSGDFYVASRTNMNIRCRDGYTQDSGEDEEDPTTTCLYGKYTAWTPFDCTPLPCAVPELGNGEVLHKQSKVESSSNVTFKCNDGHHFTETPHTAILESMCYLGEWMPAIPKHCQPDSCFIDVTNKTVYTIMESKNNMRLVTSSSLIPHGTKLSIDCEEGFDMFDQNKTILDQTEFVTCEFGTWSNVEIFKSVCHKRCVIPDDDRYFHPNTEGTGVATGELVTFKCNDGHHFTETPHTVILESMCYLGEWMPALPQHCQPDSCFIDVANNLVYMITESKNNMARVTSSSLVPHGTKLSIDCEEGFDMFDRNKTILDQTVFVICEFGTWSNVEIFKSVCHKRCEVPADERYLYINTEGAVVPAGELVAEGENLNVTCSNLDDYYDSNDVNVNVYIVTCNNGSLSKSVLECSEDKSDQCSVLENGSVVVMGARYNVTCNTGYVLNLDQLSSPYCICNRVNGVLSCFNQKPVCRPDDCFIPRNYDMQKLSVEFDGAGMTVGTKVPHGKHVTFDCQQHGGDLYEPKNRSYICDGGKWIVKTPGHRSWKHDTNGDFPKCKRVPRNCTIPQWTNDNTVTVFNGVGKPLYTELTVGHGELMDIDCGVKHLRSRRLNSFICNNGIWQQLGDTLWNMVNDGRIANCSVINQKQAIALITKHVRGLGKFMSNWLINSWSAPMEEQ